MGQARPRTVGDVEDRDLPGGEQRPQVLRRLGPVEVGREPVVDGDHALVGYHVPGHPAADGDRVQALVVPQPFHLGFPRGVTAQHVEDRAGLVDRVAAHPGAGGVRPLADGGDVGPQRALAARLDQRGRGLEQHREVAGQQFRRTVAQPEQPVAFGCHLLAVVEHVGDVPGRRGDRGGEPELDGDPRLHVRAAAAEQPLALEAGRQVARDRDGVDVPGQDDPFRPAEHGPRHDRVAVTVHGQVRQRSQRRLDGVRDRPFVAADRGHVDQPGRQRRPVKVQVENRHPASLGGRAQAGAREPGGRGCMALAA